MVERGPSGVHRSGIDAPESLLILKPSSFGDIVHTLPAVARLKAAWPKCRFSWLVNEEWSPLLQGNPDVDEIIPFPRQKFRGTMGWLNFARWCRQTMAARKPDLALDFQGLLRTALVGRASKAGLLYGMSDAREGARWFYDRVAPMPARVVHAVDRYLALATDVLGPAVPPGELRFPLPEGEALLDAKRILPRDFILLHPFARGNGKSLSALQIEAFCRRLAPRPVVLVGRRGDGQFDPPAAAIDLLDKTSLLQLIWVIRQASGVITVDSGPSHLAAALGKPLVAIHTWSDPRRVGPYRNDAWVWKSGHLLRMEQARRQDEAFFREPPTPLGAADIAAICDLAISLSGSCA